MYDTITLETGARVTGSGGGTPTPTPGITPAPTLTPTRTPTVTPTITGTGSACQVSYSVSSQWAGGFSANITISNTSSQVLNGWTLGFDFSAGQLVTQGWNATYTQQGSQVTAQSLSYNSSLAPGTSASIGFNGSWSTSNPSPMSFTLNGTACSVS